MSQWISTALEMYEAPLLRFATRLTGCPERAADVVQDAFLALCKQKPQRVADHIGQWLFTAVRNRTIDLFRKERPMLQLQEHARGFVQEPSEDLEKTEQCNFITSALQKLSERQREIILMKFHDGLRYRDIAAALGISEGTVAKTMHDALGKLRHNTIQLKDTIA